MTKQIITAETVRLAWKAGESVIVYAKGDIVTQQAQDDARHYGITLTTETPVAPSSALAEPEAEAVPPVPPVLEEVPASQEPVHVPTPALTADQLAAAARQLQEALVPLTQALTASIAPAAQPVPPVVFTPGSNPMAAEAVTASAPAEQRSDDLLVAIRRGVLSALPTGTAIGLLRRYRLICPKNVHRMYRKRRLLLPYLRRCMLMSRQWKRGRSIFNSRDVLF